MSRSESEEFCKDAFGEYLTNVLNLHGIEIVEGEDPPDYWLLCKGKKYAVEVTQIVELVQGGRKTIPIPTYYDHEYRLARNVEREARTEGYLRGKYYVGFKGGYPRYDPTRDQRQIVDAALQYIRENAAEELVDEKILFRDGRARIVISKNTNDEDYVVPGIKGVKGVWQEELVDEVNEALNDAINIKQTKLESISQSCNGILLLVRNKYVLMESDDIQ